MNKSESIKELSAALAKAQGEMKPAPMNAVNPFLKNKYADLGAIIETARPVLAKNGLSFTQLVGGDDNRMEVTTVLMHSSGEWIEGTVGLAMGEERGKSAAQVAGSIVTYLRRYSLAAIIGMYADEDNDGTPVQNARANVPVVHQNGLNSKVDAEKANLPMHAENGVKTPVLTMTIEEAEAEFSPTVGQPYGAISTEQLAHMLNGMAKVKSPTPDQERKIAAVRVILDARANGRAVNVSEVTA